MGQINGQPTFIYPDGMLSQVSGSVRTYLSDDFGGSAIDATKWTVLPGGQGAVTVNGAAQLAIGSGVSTGMSHAVASSGLTITTGTTNLAEYWVMSNQMFSGSEDLTFLFSKNTVSSANVNFWVGFVEVDPLTGNAILNTTASYNAGGFNDFTNKGGVELGTNAAGGFLQLECLGDNSAAAATIAATTFAGTLFSTSAGEVTVEFNAEDVIASYSLPDSLTGKTSTAVRVSTQVPNDTKVYKLLIRARTSTSAVGQTFTIGRLIVVDSAEARVEVKSGRGDTVVGKGLAVNVANTPTVGLSSQSATGTRNVALGATNNTGVGLSAYRTHSTTGTGANIKATAAGFYGIQITNTSAAVRYVCLFNKASAPAAADTPILSYAVPAGGSVSFINDIGTSFNAGLGWAVSDANASTYAVGAATQTDCTINVFYS